MRTVILSAPDVTTCTLKSATVGFGNTLTVMRSAAPATDPPFVNDLGSTGGQAGN